MTIWIAVLYGVLQGATEFLPVSSSGHLVLMNRIFGIECDFLFFSLILHFATLVAVVIVLRREVWSLVKHPFSRQAKFLWIATVPTVVIVLLFKGFFENAFSGELLPVCFMLTAVLLILTELLSKKTFKKLDGKTAFLIGIAQGVAVLPGISRSGATIACGCLCGLDKKASSRFSFLLSIPIILASMGYEILESVASGATVLGVSLELTFVAFAFALLVGVLCVKFMLEKLQKIRLYYFSAYLVLLAGLSFCVL